MRRGRADGSYRALASKALEGKPMGPFNYYGTRPDDPNDIFPHEHRRELRGLLAFCAWLNHDNSQSTNTLDTLVSVGGKQILRHNLLDFGSSLGSGTVQAQSPRAGNEFIWDARPTFITMLTLGFYVRPWIKVEYPDMPSVGRIESTYFNPAIVETGISQCRVRECAAGRLVLGRSDPGRPVGRRCQSRGAGRTVLGSQGDRLSDRGAARSADRRSCGRG